MATKPENAWYLKLRPELVKHFRVRRVENVVEEGDPDVYLYSGNFEPYPWTGWLELKAFTLPKRETTAVFGPRYKNGGALRPAQANQLLDLREQGVPAYVLARADHCAWLVDGELAHAFNGLTASGLTNVALWTCDHVARPTADDWRRLVDAIILGVRVY